MKEMRRVLALVLCLVMLIGIVPAAAFATESEAPAEESGYTDLGTKTAAEGNEQQDPLPEEIQQLVGAPADAPALAADGKTPIDAAIIFSDLHTRSDDDISDRLGDVSGHRYTTAGGHLTGILGAMKGLPVSSVTSAGDAFAVDNDGDLPEKGKFIGYTSVLNGYINSVFPGVPVNYVWTDHDRYAKGADNDKDLDQTSRFVYGAGDDGIYGNADDDNYYIFLLSMRDTTHKTRYNVAPQSEDVVKANIQKFLAGAAALDTTKPLFIVAHQPLLDNRNDNGFAYLWWDAIDDVAQKMDVAYFFGHNHYYDKESDYYYAKGSDMSVCDGSSQRTVTLSFAHMCAGYMNPTTGSESKNTRQKVAIAAIIYEDKIEYKSYNATGLDTSKWKLDKTANRDFIVDSIAASATKTEYAYGEAFDESTVTVTATYGNDTTAAVTGYTLSGYDMNVAGEQTVTVTYKGKTATFTITVAAPVVEEPEEPEMVTVSAEATYVDINGEHQPNGDTIAATGIGLTGITAVWNDVDVSSVLDDYAYAAYDVALEGYTEGDVTVTLNVGYVDAESEVKLYFINEDGSLEEVADFEAVPYEPEAELVEDAEEDEEYGYTAAIVTFTVSAPSFTVAVGNPSEQSGIPADAVLDSLSLVLPEKLKYFDTDAVFNEELNSDVIYLDITGMDVSAHYSLGEETYVKTLEWNQGGDVEDGYALSFVPLVPGEYGEKTVTVTYGDKTATFPIWVCPKNVPIEGEEDVAIDFDTPSVMSMTVDKVKTPEMMDIATTALEDLVTGILTIYNFDATYANGDTELSGTATVTLPIPEKVNNPVVYYVSDNGNAIEKMPVTVNGDGTLTFTTTHFSNYVVGEENNPTGVDVEPVTVPVTLPAGKKTVYVLTNGNPSGDVLIVNGNTAGSFYAVSNGNGNVASTAVTVKQDSGIGTYIELDDATDELWTVSTSRQTYTFVNSSYLNSSYYLYPGSRGLRLDTSSRAWTYSENKLYYSNRYLTCNNGSWSTTNSGSNIYFYKATQIDTKPVEGTYSIKGNPVELQAAAPYYNGNTSTNRTVTLSSTITFTPKDSNLAPQTVTGTPTYSIEYVDKAGNTVDGDPNEIIRGINGNTVTLSGKAGIALVQVSCTTSAGVVTDYIEIIARKPTYTLNITTNNGEPIVTSFQGSGTLNLEAQLSANFAGVQAPSGGKYTWDMLDSDDDVVTLSTSSTNTVVATYTGKTGTDTVRVTYTWTENGETKTLYDLIEIQNLGERTEVKIFHDGEEKDTVPVKGVTNDHTVVLEVTAKYYSKDNAPNGENLDGPPEWEILSGDAKIFDADGWITYADDSHEKVTLNLSGEGGMATIRVKYSDGAFDDITINAAKTTYYTPEDGTDDFPDFPNPGAVVLDKTATAVGDFNKTGITQVELSMFGMPVQTGSTLDIVLLLDRSSSMDDNSTRIPHTIAAAQAFVEAVAVDNNGKPSGHNILVADYHGGKMNDGTNLYGADIYNDPEKYPFTFTATYPSVSNRNPTTASGGFQVLAETADVNAIKSKIAGFALGYNPPSGTDYDHALQYAYAALKAARDAGSTNQQVVVMMTDGVPTHLRFEGTLNYSSNTVAISGSNPQRYLIYGCTNNDDMKSMFLKQEKGTVSSRGTDYDFTNRGPNYRYEVISDDLKAAGVTVFTVGLGLFNTNGAWDYGTYKASANDCGNAASVILNDISGPANETTKDTGTALSKKDKYFFEVADGNVTALTSAFENIAGQIRAAASNVVAEDKVSEDYTMVFEVPNGLQAGAVPEDQEFYIEVLEYELNDEHNRTGEYESLIKLYLGKNASGYYAASDAQGTEFEAPQFEAAGQGKQAYWTTDDKKADTYDVKNADGTVTQKKVAQVNGYYFTKEGDGSHNMTAGAVASGTVDAETNTSQNITIATPYFVYNAENKMLTWTTDKLGDTSQMALRYFLYLDGSAGVVSDKEGTQLNPGPYTTNDWATLTYINHNGNECKKYFPVPQQTWSGAQVGFTFYLVNKDGEPINRSGQVVDLASATFVTGTFYEHVVWNSEALAEPLRANILASDYLPEEYCLYDEDASYTIHVYKRETGTVESNFFVIGGSDYGDKQGVGTNEHLVKNQRTTYVYNTINSTRYNEYGTYSSETDGNGKITYRVVEDGQEVTRETTVDHVTGKDIDYSATTVAFGVLWIPTMAEDTIVVDYGLPVAINVVQNDQLDNTVNAIGTRVNNDVGGQTVEMNTGIATRSLLGLYQDQGEKFENNTLTMANGNRVVNYSGVLYFVQDDMEFSAPSVFYYDSKVSFTQDGVEKNGYMYSKVTVIPATTVYYEDSFLELDAYLNNTNIAKDDPEFWTTEGKTQTNATQSADRPGDDRFHLPGYDADNPYGYDPVYDNCSEYSLGSAKKITVYGNKYGTATFDFYGTGFDVISMTSNTTGSVAVRVYAWDEDKQDFNTRHTVSRIVDTYYGYAYDADKDEWVVVDSEDSGALYQVPVLKISGLNYGRYRAMIVTSYSDMFDHTGNGGYDFYLDAIRVYNPCGVDEVVDNKGTESKEDDITVGDIYGADGELDPTYVELRNQIIEKNTMAEFFVVENIKEFAKGVTYYTKDAVGRFAVVTATEKPEENVVYYTMVSNVKVDGAVYITSTFIDGKGTEATLDDYKNFGPNNEVYLANGQAVATKLAVTTEAPAANYEPRVYLGIKSVGGKASVDVYGIDENGKKTVAVDNKELSTATDMYYDITNLIGKVVVIRNSGSEGIVSITNVKTAYEEDETKTKSGNEEGLTPNSVNAAAETEESMFTVDSETLKLALLSLSEPIKVEQPDAPEGGEPGGNEPGGEPEGGEPGGNEPGGEPGGNEPGGEPEGGEPGGNEPGGEPEGGEPGGNEPGGEPEGGEPGGNEPGGEPEGGEPGGNEPGGEPEGGEPGGDAAQDPAPSEPVPEETEPEEKESIEETIQDIVEIIRDIIGIIGGMFRGWF